MSQKEKEFVNILNIIVEEAFPADINLWPQIQTQLKTRAAHPKPFWRWSPTTRLGWISLTFILVFSFSSVTYAIGPILSQLFQADPGLQHVQESDLVQPLNLSQTIEGITITIEQAYADANRIAIEYALTGPEDRRFEPQDLRLTHLPDTDLPLSIGSGNGEGRYHFTFAAANVQGAPRQLDLQVMIYAEEWHYTDEIIELLEQYGSHQAIPADKIPRKILAGKGEKIGPFTFDFTLPFLPSQTLSIQQTVEAAGARVRLEEVSITPSQTQATLCVTPPAGGEAFTDWDPITELNTGQNAPLSAGMTTVFRHTDQEFCHQLIFPYALADQPGQWTMTVTELVGFHKTDVDKQMRPAGPWVFQFDVP